MMSPSQLADLLLSPLTTDYMMMMMGRMQTAMAYHRSDYPIIRLGLSDYPIIRLG
jgi:hypothetical protein